MSALAEELIEHTDEIVQRWCERWTAATVESKRGLSEESLKDHLPAQLRFIAEQLRQASDAERPRSMWQGDETQGEAKLAPEERVSQDVPIGEVVQEYGLLVDTVRDWIEERDIDIDFRDYSYFYQAVFELTAESVRRYAEHQAELVAKERREYLAGVAHQMRTPLSALANQVEVIELDDALDEPTVSRLRRLVRRLELLVGGVMRIERFAPDEIPLRPRPILVADFAARVLEDHTALARRKGIRLESRAEPSLEVHLDEGLCLDALGNLVDNAIKHTREGFVRLTARADDDTVTFEVTDSGTGIPKDRLGDLFEPTRPDQQHGGAGLGLAIACHAVRAQNGRIEVQSEVGRGSTFRVVLPREVAEREAL